MHMSNVCCNSHNTITMHLSRASYIKVQVYSLQAFIPRRWTGLNNTLTACVSSRAVHSHSPPNVTPFPNPKSQMHTGRLASGQNAAGGTGRHAHGMSRFLRKGAINLPSLAASASTIVTDVSPLCMQPEPNHVRKTRHAVDQLLWLTAAKQPTPQSTHSFQPLPFPSSYSPKLLLSWATAVYDSSAT